MAPLLQMFFPLRTLLGRQLDRDYIAIQLVTANLHFVLDVFLSDG